jgi:hypothetical protein
MTPWTPPSKGTTPTTLPLEDPEPDWEPDEAEPEDPAPDVPAPELPAPEDTEPDEVEPDEVVPEEEWPDDPLPEVAPDESEPELGIATLPGIPGGEPVESPHAAAPKRPAPAVATMRRRSLVGCGGCRR